VLNIIINGVNEDLIVVLKFLQRSSTDMSFLWTLPTF
jgi:phage-related protein